MKKFLVVVLALLMVMSSAAMAANTYEKGEYTLPIVSEPTQLVWMGRDSESAGTSFLNENALVWNEIEKATGIDIVWDVVPNAEYQQIMELRMASLSDLPDIVCLQGTADGAHLVKYYNEGIIENLTDLINDYAPNIQRLFETYPAYKSGLTMPDGAIVAFGDANVSDHRGNAVQIRKDWLDKLGLEDVKNADELYEAAKAFVTKDPNGNGEADEYGFVAGSLFEYKQLGSAFGLSLCTGSGWVVEDGTVVYEWVTDDYKDFLTWMNKAYTEGLIPKDFQSVDGSTKDSRIATDTAGIVCRQGITQMVDWNNPTNSVQTNTPGAKWMPVGFVADEKYDPCYPLELTASIWRSYAITTECSDKIAAIRLFDYMLYGEGYGLNTCGIEGLNYEMKDGYVVNIPNWQQTLEDTTSFIGTNYFARITADDRQMAGLLADYLAADEELKAWTIESMDKVVDIAYVTWQTPIPTNEQAIEISTLTGDMDTYRDEAFVKFITGDLSIEKDWDAYVANMETLGYGTIRDIYQQGYDAQNK